MPLTLELDRCLAPPLPAARGIPGELLARYEERSRAALKALRESPPGFLEALGDRAGLAAVQSLAERCRAWRHILLLGIGGSALGARTIRDALCPPGSGGAASPRLTVLDNSDPRAVEDALSSLPLEDTLVIAISKSGSTVETIAGLLHVWGLMTAAGLERWQDRLVVITDPERGPLRELARREGIAALPIPPQVGGRFSVLTPVGLFPAALIGVDIDALLAGAADLAAEVLAQPPAGATERLHGVAAFAALQAALTFERGAAIQVLMCYSERLRTFGAWFAQLWAESLGKRRSRSGAVVERGSTPLPAVGSTDQHSLVQLFMEGPADKQFLVVGVEEGGARCPIDARAGEVHESFAYLGSHDLAELLFAQRRGTVHALVAAGRPTAELTLARLDPRHLGALFCFFEVATALAGDLYDVDPYDQPGVEAGKVAAFALMGRPGYEEQARALGQSEGSGAAPHRYTLAAGAGGER